MSAPLTSAWRSRLLFLALAATLAAAFWVSRQEEPAVPTGRLAEMRATAFPAAQRQDATLPAQPLLMLPVRTPATAPVVDPFAVPAAAPAAAAAAKPVAPPLPFVYMGRYVERGITHVFLEQGEQMHMAKVGDIIDNLYRVDSIDNAVRLTYLPTQEKQLLEIGDL